jgi:hypothetical protein
METTSELASATFAASLRGGGEIGGGDGLIDQAQSAAVLASPAEIPALFARLRQEYGIAILYSYHDLASVASLCDRVSKIPGTPVRGN